MIKRALRFVEMEISTLDSNAAQSLASEQAQSYLAAINALSLIAKELAWVVLSFNDVQNSSVWSPLCFSPLRPLMDHQVYRRAKVRHHVPEDQFGTVSTDIAIFTLSDLRRKFALVTARLRAAPMFTAPTRACKSQSLCPTRQISDNLVVTNDDPDGAVSLYFQSGWMEEAFGVAETLKVDLSTLFESLARRCARLTQLAGYDK